MLGSDVSSSKEGEAYAGQHWLRLFDEQDPEKLVWIFRFPAELGGFKYTVDRPFFHTFPGKVGKIFEANVTDANSDHRVGCGDCYLTMTHKLPCSLTRCYRR